MPTIIDADNIVLGRVASVIAKRLLSGEDIVVVNAGKALIQGSRKQIFDDYHEKRTRGSQRKGPFYPAKPERIFKRTVRGMLPYQKGRGREAFKRLRVYSGTPKSIKPEDIQKLPELAKAPKRAIRLEDVSHNLDPNY
jgi:large subunit ribosomal protein L13